MKPYLKTQGLFEQSSDVVIRLAERNVRYRTFERHDVVVSQGDPDSPLLLVFSGELQATGTLEDGREIGMGRIAPGHSFGESAIILDIPAIASAVSLTRSVVGLISRPHARQLFNEPTVAQSLLATLSNKLHQAIEGKSTLTRLRACSRVYAVIYADLKKKSHDMPHLIELPGQEAVALAANVSRETVSRAIRSLAQRGVVVKQGRKLQIKDCDSLARLAAGEDFAVSTDVRLIHSTN